MMRWEWQKWKWIHRIQQKTRYIRRWIEGGTAITLHGQGDPCIPRLQLKTPRPTGVRCCWQFEMTAWHYYDITVIGNLVMDLPRWFPRSNRGFAGFLVPRSWFWRQRPTWPASSGCSRPTAESKQDTMHLIARFMGPTWAQLGPTGPRWAPSWPHELCYLGISASVKIWRIV